MNKKNIENIKTKIKSLDFTPKKFLNQNFLINTTIVKKILSQVSVFHPQFIMEIGPGLGALTIPLQRLSIPFQVVEKDHKLCEFWEHQVPLIKGDILKIPWTSYLKKKSLLLGNLPYQVAGRLLVDCAKDVKNLQFMVLMFQKEMAERIMATYGSKTYGFISVLSQCVWHIKAIATALPQDFYPQPKVAGQVLVFEKKPLQPGFLVTPFSDFVKLCFSHRRKFLLSCLKKEFSIDIKELFDKINLSKKARAEDISPKHFMQLFNYLPVVDKTKFMDKTKYTDREK